MRLLTSVVAFVVVLAFSASSTVALDEHDVEAREYVDHDLEARFFPHLGAESHSTRSFDDDELAARAENILDGLEVRYGDDEITARDIQDAEIEARSFEELSDLYARAAEKSRGRKYRLQRSRHGKKKFRKLKKARKHRGGKRHSKHTEGGAAGEASPAPVAAPAEGGESAA